MMTGLFTYNGSDVPFHFQDTLSMSQKLKIVANVTNTVVGSLYLPMFKEVAAKYYILKECCIDLDLSMMETTEKDDSGQEHIYPNWDEVALFTSKTNAFESVASGLKEQYTEILENIDDNISYISGIDKTSIGAEIINLLKNVNRTVDSWKDLLTEDMLKDIFERTGNLESTNKEN